MRKAMEQRKCDQCGREQAVDPKAFGPGFSEWITVKMPDKGQCIHPYGTKRLDFCHVQCAQVYLTREVEKDAERVAKLGRDATEKAEEHCRKSGGESDD